MASSDHDGGMEVPFVQAQLEEFNCALGTHDELDDLINKMNALSTAYSLISVDFMDALIAFMKNGRKSKVSMQILDNFEHQVLLRMNDAKKRPTKRSATTDFYRKCVLGQPDRLKQFGSCLETNSEKWGREVLKELPLPADFAFSFAVCADDGPAFGVDEPLPLDDSEQQQQQHRQDNKLFETFDDHRNYAPPQSKISKTMSNSAAAVVVSNGFAWPFKSSFSGESFVAIDASSSDEQQATAMPNLRIINECDDGEPFANGHRDECDTVFSSDEFNAENQQAPSSSSTQLLSGTICATEGKCLSFQSVSLTSESRTFPLDFGNIDSISIYPGMEIATKCVVDDNQLFHVQSVVEPPLLELAPLAILRQMDQQQLSRLKVVIARGPFLRNASPANFDQFVQLLNSVAAAQANALILCGPFVPHGMELSSETESPEALFADLLAEIVKHLTDQLPFVRVLIVPNAQFDQLNVGTPCSCFPTPPLLKPQSIILPNNVTFLPDPALFELESVHFAISSSEILLHLCKTEICKSANVENEDRMCRLISHLFRSRCLYPLFPADRNLPFSPSPSAHAKLRLPTKPHVMILPSMLQPVTKVVDGCVTINPGRFDRGMGTGTFSMLDLNLSSSDPIDANSISQFCAVSLFSTTTS